ncbi:bacillithiol biosynthesis cysteine-adding enzyme BshC [Terriglobus albidus]|uniref:Putative cysteine ligase BshC n=1 Tax=Terriglobus albidus TaxID=1592106 RepID=A0A5B9EAM5_9BACT|nr:bacillithiol biosynthesis cysteine-adding enzyme BshC [Terriglobus albidus]QEE27710.1 bacillithiol biosynthesis cysteine-adding enzyme BshC [Terriglobus albidus]
MRSECYPITVLPGVSRLFREYLAHWDNPILAESFGGHPADTAWRDKAPELTPEHRARLVSLLESQNPDPSPAARRHLEMLRDGAGVVVSGQQVGILGGPLYTLFKAATAVRRAKEATEAGVPHVPIFWPATEDHDLDEVNQVLLLTKNSAETLRLKSLVHRNTAVGGVVLPEEITELVEQATELLAWAPITETLKRHYAPGKTLAEAFTGLLREIFAAEGLLTIDAAERGYHELGSPVLLAAIEQAEELEAAVRARSQALVDAGYHAQVLLPEQGSLLFLFDEQTGERHALRHKDGAWKAGHVSYTTEELKALLLASPERFSPNALLRPVFQDQILPTSAYIGGPAEIAYFAQSGVLYDTILGRRTTVLPRMSATLVEPAIAKVMDQHELGLKEAFSSADDLALRLGARAMPVEGKKRLQAAGNALDRELDALLGWMQSVDGELARSGEVSASKMRYQMNRLRRMSARFEQEKNASLRKHADAVTLNLFPEGHVQERAVAGTWFLARTGDDFPAEIVSHAGQECSGHKAIFL